MKLALNPEYNLYEKNGAAYCDSLQIAETFEKRHADVLRDIDKTLLALTRVDKRKFAEINFLEANYKDGGNRKQPMYFLTKNGFAKIVLAYEGKKATRFQVEYIERFEAMEQFIHSLSNAKLEHPAFTQAIMDTHDEPKHYHYSNESDMINRIVLGMSAKQFRIEHGVQSGHSIRPYLNTDQIKAVEDLQRIDIGLLYSMSSFEDRKNTLYGIFSNQKRISA